ncbi:MAG: thioesterase domain-containing protein [Myxococcota bacterium]
MDRTDRELRLAVRRQRLSAAAREALDARLRGERVADRPSCVVPLAAGEGAPLFCVHPAGGDVLGYSAVARHALRPHWGLQAPGLVGEAQPDTIPALAERYADAVDAVAPAGPVLLAGWSLGAHVAFEMGRALTARGRAPALIALIDADPEVPDPESLPAPGDPVPWLRSIAEYVERIGGRPLGWEVDALDPPHSLRERFLAALRHADPALAGVGASPERLERLIAVFEANTRALARYRPEPSDGPLTLLQCRDSSFADGWAARTRGSLAVHAIPGDHYTLVVEPNAAVLARTLESLARAATSEGA